MLKIFPDLFQLITHYGHDTVVSRLYPHKIFSVFAPQVSFGQLENLENLLRIYVLDDPVLPMISWGVCE